MEIKKVWMRKDGIKFVIIPKHSEIKSGDYVKIIKLENDEGGENGNREKTRRKKGKV